MAIATDRDAQTAAAVVSALRANDLSADAVTLDVTDEGAVAKAFEAVEQRHGVPDILVNNAGISIRKGLTDLSLDEWELVQKVNVTGAFLCSREAARQMAPRGSGAIVNVASIMGLSGGGAYPNPSYQASKGALVNLTRALAIELAPSGIRVNAVAPTWVSPSSESSPRTGRRSDGSSSSCRLDTSPSRTRLPPSSCSSQAGWPP